MLGATPRGNPIAPQLLDPVRHRDRVLVLPHSYHYPARFLKGAAVAMVTGGVRVELGSPPVCVRLRSDRMLRTTMPEAAIHEDGDLRPRQDNVGAAWEVRDVHPETESATVQFAPDGKLRSRSHCPEA